MSEKNTFATIVVVVALAGLVLNFSGGATGMSGSKGTIMYYPTPTYYDTPHRDFPEVSWFAYYQYGIRTAEGQQGLDLAPTAAREVLLAGEADVLLNDYTAQCSIACRNQCGDQFEMVGLREVQTECLEACTSLCKDLIEQETTFLHD